MMTMTLYFQRLSLINAEERRVFDLKALVILEKVFIFVDIVVFFKLLQQFKLG